MCDPEEYTVGWICAVNVESMAARLFLDKAHQRPTGRLPRNGPVVYRLGEMAGHKVVIACLPNGQYGVDTAARVAQAMVLSFPNIRICLMVGIAGGAPTAIWDDAGKKSDGVDIRLGDVVVSEPGEVKTKGSNKKIRHGGVYHYDYGKAIQDQPFEATRLLDQPSDLLRSAADERQETHFLEGNTIHETIMERLDGRDEDVVKKFKRPEDSSDRLYPSNFVHKDPGEDCSACETASSAVAKRPQRPDNKRLQVFYGRIGSGTTLMKDAIKRDEFAKEDGILCFEMEAAGLMNLAHCLVIRGICDYSDSHKNKDWQGYAAMAAAAYAKELLAHIPPEDVEMVKVIREVNDQLKNMNTSLNLLSSKVTAIDERRADEEYAKLLNKLSTLDCSSKHQDICNKRPKGPGKGFLQTNTYKTWLKTPKKILLCQGMPGAGKTILTSLLIDDLTNRFEKETSIGVAYIYCHYKEIQTPSELTGSLIKQFAGRHRSEMVVEKITTSLHGIESHFEEPPSPEEIEKALGRPLSLEEMDNALVSLANQCSRVFIVIDSLDECSMGTGIIENSRSRLITLLHRLHAEAEANIFVTTRLDSDLGKEFQPCMTEEIRATDEDIAVFFDENMSNLPDFVQGDSDEARQFQKTIKETVTNSVHGMFLLARLRIESLIGMQSRDEVRRALKHFSQGSVRATNEGQMYDEAYDKSMERVRGQLKNFRNLAMETLQWISYAKRPLSPEELLDALATEVGKTFLREANYTTIEQILSACVGLVAFDKSSNIMRLIHYTAQEYFDRKKSKWFPSAESDITSVCTTYLAFDRFEEGPPKRGWSAGARTLLEYPFYKYAANNWGHHARELRVAADELELPKFLFSAKKVRAATSTMVGKPFDFRAGLFWSEGRLLHNEPSSVHLLAAFGIVNLVKKILIGPQKALLNSRDNFGHTPLFYAVGSGHLDVVKLLFDESSDILEERNQSGETPLHIAAQYGQEEIVQFLMDKGADIDAKCNLHETPLYCATNVRHKRIVDMLLERGAKTEIEARPLDAEEKFWNDLTPQPEPWRRRGNGLLSPLHSFYGRKESPNDHELIELLLKRGAKADAITEYGTTFLHQCTDLDKWELLLKYDANVDARDDKGWTPLSHIAFEGSTRFFEGSKEGPIEFLLRHGANVNGDRLDEESGKMVPPEFTPLMLTVHRKWNQSRDNKDEARALLNGGADANRTSPKGLTALQMAARNRAKGVVEVLLGSGLVDVNFKVGGQGFLKYIFKLGFYKETALSLAVRQTRNEAVINLLLRDGRADASLDVKNVDGQTPLDQARYDCNKSYEQILCKAIERRDKASLPAQ